MSTDAPRPDWMTDNRKIIRVGRSIQHFGVDIIIGTKTHIGQPIVFEEIPSPGFATITNPTLSLTTEEAQKLMDELWACYIRPSNGEGSVGQIGALKDHLTDLRKIVFRDLNIKEE